jgi:Nucleotidyl transferase AbiEii toxin, Type IV TA system
MDYAMVKHVLAALERENVRYAVFGGAALNFHGIARFTEDLDLFIAPKRENIDALRRALHTVFDDPDIDEISAEDLLGDYPAIQYIPPEGTFHLDILTRLGEAFRFEDLESERIQFDDLTISVVTPATLYEMKHDTVRLKDRADAELLRERFGVGEK